MVALQDTYDIAILISGDADGIPGINYVKGRSKHVGVAEFRRGAPADFPTKGRRPGSRSRPTFVVQVYEADLIRRNLAYRAEPDYPEHLVRAGEPATRGELLRLGPTGTIGRRRRYHESSPAPSLRFTRFPSMPNPRVLVLRAPGTNCDEESRPGLATGRGRGRDPGTSAGSLEATRRRLDAFQVLTLPGGFSYGDDLGAGQDPRHPPRAPSWAMHFARLVDRGGLVLGICNGFQVLVKAGLLPGGASNVGPATLTFNDSGHFESRWVAPRPPRPAFASFLDSTPTRSSSPSPTARGSSSWQNPAALATLEAAGQVVLRYAGRRGASPHRRLPRQPRMDPPAPWPASATPPAGSSA